MPDKKELLKEQVIRASGVNPLKCMRCGKCSGTCPSYDEMEYHPHQFVYMVETGDIETLMKSESVYKCLIEAVRLEAIRQKGNNHMTADDIPEKINDDIPQQAIMSAMRKYSK